MTILGACTVTDGSNNIVATGLGHHEYDPQVQVADVVDNGLQVGGHYTLTDPDGKGWHGLTFTGLDGNIANFDNTGADAF